MDILDLESLKLAPPKAGHQVDPVSIGPNGRSLLSYGPQARDFVLSKMMPLPTGIFELVAIHASKRIFVDHLRFVDKVIPECAQRVAGTMPPSLAFSATKTRDNFDHLAAIEVADFFPARLSEQEPDLESIVANVIRGTIIAMGHTI